MKAYKPKAAELAGFDLIGYRQPNGKIRLGSQSGTLMADFPENVEMCGNVYSLEIIKKNKVPKGHPGEIIEWGCYV